MASLGSVKTPVNVRSFSNFYVTIHGKYHQQQVLLLNSAHSSTKPITEDSKCDMIGPPDPVSNLRPIKFHIPANETSIEKRLRLKRQEVQQWNQDFWASHNSKFVKPNSNNRSRSLVLSQPKNNSNSAKSVASVPGDLNDNERTKIREEVFQNWLQTKKLEQLRKREQEEKIKQIALEEKQIKREAAEISYAIWKHKKDEERKAKEMKERQLRNEEHQRREVELKKTVSREKVSEWMKMAKYKPRPVPSNLGLISLTVTNPPSYYNPQPWVNPEPA